MLDDTSEQVFCYFDKIREMWYDLSVFFNLFFMKKWTKLFAFLGFFILSVSQVFAQEIFKTTIDNGNALNNNFMIKVLFWVTLGLCIFILLRELNCWYWKINEAIENLKWINKNLERIADVCEKAQKNSNQ